MKTVTVRPLNTSELKIAAAFQRFVVCVAELFTLNKGRYGIQNLQHYEDVKRRLVEFQKLPFAKPLFAEIKKWDTSIAASLESASKHAEYHGQLGRVLDDTVQSFMSSKFEDFATQSAQLQKLCHLIEPGLTSPDTFLKSVFNPYHMQNALIFGQRDGFLQQFTEHEVHAIANIDLTKPLFTYLRINKEGYGDFEFLAYWIMHLRSSSKKVQLSDDEFIMYSKATLANNSSYQELTRIIKKYLYDNDRSLIPKIVELLDETPLLKQENEKAKRDVHVVYRGVPLNVADERLSNAAIISRDREVKYIATTKSKKVATRFAYQIGHLESNRRSTDGVVIEYKVDPKSVVLDLKIFGGLFGESEVIIDATKAQIQDVYRV